MVVTLERVQFKFASIIGELCSQPDILSQFAVWVDLRLAEYKLKGSISLDCFGETPDPIWLKGIVSALLAKRLASDKAAVLASSHAQGTVPLANEHKRHLVKLRTPVVKFSRSRTAHQSGEQTVSAPPKVVVKGEPEEHIAYPASFQDHAYLGDAAHRKRAATETASFETPKKERLETIPSHPIAYEDELLSIHQPSDQTVVTGPGSGLLSMPPVTSSVSIQVGNDQSPSPETHKGIQGGDPFLSSRLSCLAKKETKIETVSKELYPDLPIMDDDFVIPDITESSLSTDLLTASPGSAEKKDPFLLHVKDIFMTPGAKDAVHSISPHDPSNLEYTSDFKYLLKLPLSSGEEDTSFEESSSKALFWEPKTPEKEGATKEKLVPSKTKDSSVETTRRSTRVPVKPSSPEVEQKTPAKKKPQRRTVSKDRRKQEHYYTRRIFERWLRKTYPTDKRKIESIPPNELDPLLAHFFSSIKNRSGEDYDHGTFRKFHGHLSQYLLDCGYPCSITTSERFKRSLTAFTIKRDSLRNTQLKALSASIQSKSIVKK